MNKLLARILSTALVLGLLTVSAGAVTPTVSTPGLADSPFLPSYPRELPPPPSIDTPFVPDIAWQVAGIDL